MVRELNSLEKAAIKREQVEIAKYDKRLANLNEKVEKVKKLIEPEIKQLEELRQTRLSIIAKIEARVMIDDTPACVSHGVGCKPCSEQISDEVNEGVGISFPFNNNQ